MMRRLKYFLAGSLIGVGSLVGLLCLLAAIWAGDVDRDANASPNATATDAVGIFLLLGAPPIMIGSALWWVGAKRDQERQVGRLQQVFFKLLQQNQGRMTVLDFAMAAKLDGEAAKTYLDSKALEFSADFDVNSEGAMLYCFNTAMPEVKSLQPEEPTYDVILQDYPVRKQEAIAAAVLRLSDLSETQVKAVMRDATKRPTAISNGVSQIVAEGLRERLEDLGATVLVILR